MNRSKSWGRHLVVLGLGLLALTMAVSPLAGAAAAPVRGEYDAAVQKAAGWIAGQQQPDGSFPGFGPGSTADALFALTAAGRSGDPRVTGGLSALDYLASKAPSYVKTPGAAAKTLLAIAATGETRDSANFGGVDLLTIMLSSYDAASGHYGKDVTGQALVILAFVAYGQAIPPAALTWLANAQGSEGGWAFDGSTGAGSADTNTTGLVLQALAAGQGSNASVAQKAIAYLHTQQNPDGGFPYQHGPGNASDANSTAMVIMGLQAAGENPDSAAWKQGGASPLDFLSSLQNASGALRFQATPADDNAGATYQAVPALAQMTLPIAHLQHPGTGGPLPGAPTPGMPTTGSGDGFAAPLIALLAALALLAAGTRLRVGRGA